MYYNYFWWSFGHWLFILIIIALIFAFIGSGKRRRWHDWHDHQSRDNAEDILKERFAKGEISEEEFKKRLDALRSSHRQ